MTSEDRPQWWQLTLWDGVCTESYLKSDSTFPAWPGVKRPGGVVETGHVGDYGTIQDGLNGLVWDTHRRTSTRKVCGCPDLKKLLPIELGSPAGRPIRQLRRGQRVGCPSGQQQSFYSQVQQQKLKWLASELPWDLGETQRQPRSGSNFHNRGGTRQGIAFEKGDAIRILEGCWIRQNIYLGCVSAIYNPDSHNDLFVVKLPRLWLVHLGSCKEPNIVHFRYNPSFGR